MNDQDDSVGWAPPDRYGIPANYFGHVDDDFYGMVGRIVMLAALVELKLFELACTVDTKPRGQERYAGKPPRNLIDTICGLLSNARPNLRDDATALLSEVSAALDARNDVVHSSWPHPTLDNAYGWRPAPPWLRSDGGQWIAEVEFDEGKLRELISEFVHIVDALPKYRQRIEDERQRRTGAS